MRMSLGQKISFSFRRGLLRFIRPLIGNRAYTKRYILLLRHAGVDIASFSSCGFIATSVHFDKYDFSLIHIGRNVYLTHDVILLVHDQSAVTAWNYSNQEDDKGTLYHPRGITIGDNVFIGMRSIIMPGTTIGDDVVIGAGSVVSGNIPAGTVWAGNPARQIETMGEYASKLEASGAFDVYDESEIR